MSYRIAWDTSPDDPNPHPWDLDPAPWPTFAAAEEHAEEEVEEIRREYGDEYANDNMRFLVVKDSRT